MAVAHDTWVHMKHSNWDVSEICRSLIDFTLVCKHIDTVYTSETNIS